MHGAGYIEPAAGVLSLRYNRLDEHAARSVGLKSLVSAIRLTNLEAGITQHRA